MSWKSWDFPLQYWDFLHLKSDFPHLKSDFPYTKSDVPKSAIYFLQWLSTFFNGFLTFFDGFPLSLMAFRFSPTAFHFPRNQRKAIYGKKYTKDRYSRFVFFATHSPSFVIPAKQYLRLTQHILSLQSLLVILSCLKSSLQSFWIKLQYMHTNTPQSVVYLMYLVVGHCTDCIVFNHWANLYAFLSYVPFASNPLELEVYPLAFWLCAYNHTLLRCHRAVNSNTQSSSVPCR